MCKENETLLEVFKKICISNGIKEGDIFTVECPNQYVAEIEILSNKVAYINNCIPYKDKDEKTLRFSNRKELKQDLKFIFLILESPTDKEYKDDKALGPAIGVTGTNISKYLLSNIMKYRLMNDLKEEGCYLKTNNEISEGKYYLYLFNIVPFICKSKKAKEDTIEQKKQNDEIKNNIVVGCFEQDLFKVRLIDEIKKIIPSIIINCCTKSSAHNQINEILIKEFSHLILLEGDHPSSSYFPEGFNKIEY